MPPAAPSPRLVPAVLAAMLAAGLLSPPAARAETASLDCGSAKLEKGDPDGRVKRVGEHGYRIRLADREIRLHDKPPYDEPLSGTRYEYCGQVAGYWLFDEAADGMFGGLLIDQRTGARLPAGQTVVFSPDHRAYLAMVQPDGLDGMEWTVYAVDGARMSWHGYNFIPRRDTKDLSSDADLSDPRWTDKGVLQATATCWGGTKTWTVSLVDRGHGWDWSPAPRCKH